MTLTPQLVYNSVRPMDGNCGCDGIVAAFRRLFTDPDQPGHGKFFHDRRCGANVLV